jgi:predicted nucleic acid-binding protein
MQPGCLIHLDNDYLAKLPEVGGEYRDVQKWILNQHPIATSAIAWNEFLRGATNSGRSKAEKAAVKDLLSAGIVPFDEESADMAAYLFNQIQRPTGSQIKLRMDCLIAASAIASKAILATRNVSHFRLFVPYQLELIDIEP